MVETTYRLPGAPHLALLTDLHNHPYSPVISSLKLHRPTLIAIAGDILYGSHPGDESPLHTQDNVLPFLQACADLAPTFLFLGNHEWALDEADLGEIREIGVVLLDNEWTATQVEGKKIIIGGLTSGYVLDYRKFLAGLDERTERYPKKASVSGVSGLVTTHKPDTAWLDEFCSIPGYHLLLSHHPEYLPLIPANINLVLSGHAHGGQWRFFRHGLFAPGQISGPATPRVCMMVGLW